MHYNTSKLKGRIIEKYGSQKEFSRAVNKTEAYISLYLNGNVFLDQRTIDEWAEKLGIPSDGIYAYFFAK